MQKIKPFYAPLKEPCSVDILDNAPVVTSEEMNDGYSHYRKIRESLPDNTTMNLYLCSSKLSNNTKACFSKEGGKKYV